MITNVRLAGLGGQGIIRASDILAEVAFRLGRDVKKSELHGMSQRGGSVTSDVRFGDRVWSPMIPAGEVDFLLVTAAEEVEHNLPALRAGGVLIRPEEVPADAALHPRSLNVALLGILSRYLDWPEAVWREVIREAFAGELAVRNERAFQIGRGVTLP